MTDPRFTKLAEVLIKYSTATKPGEKILFEAIDIPTEMTCELVRVARELGADPLVMLKDTRVDRALRLGATESQFNLIADVETLQMSNVQSYVGLRGNLNISEMADVPEEQSKIWQSTVWQRVHIDTRVPKTKWAVVRWPHSSMAQQAGKSTAAFEDFYFDVCTLDYQKMANAMKPLVARMDAADKVKIVGPGTELSFSIKGLKGCGCAGQHNIPDGEAFTAPVKDSVNGTLRYTAKTIYRGVVHDDICLEFKDGKIIKATSSNTEQLNKVLDTDDGSRYVGEFALGFNPYITAPMLDILFDEKIAGSFHFTPGQAYEGPADNGNRSTVHWDMVCIQTPEYGGGEIWFDGELIRKDGMFVPDDLKQLNPENLK